MKPVKTFKTFSKDVITLLEKLNVHNVVSKSEASNKLISAGNMYFVYHGNAYYLHIHIICVPDNSNTVKKINYILYLFRNREDFPNRSKNDNEPFSRIKLITTATIEYDSDHYDRANWNDAAENKIIGMISDIEKADKIRMDLVLKIRDMLEERLYHYPAIDTTIYFGQRFNTNLNDGVVKFYINDESLSPETFQINIDKRIDNYDNKFECLVFYGTERDCKNNKMLPIGYLVLEHDNEGNLTDVSERKLLMTLISCIYCPRLNGYGVYSVELPVNNYVLDCKNPKFGYRRLIPVSDTNKKSERLVYDNLHPLLRYYDLLTDSLLFCKDALPSYNEEMEDKLDIVECTLSLDSKNRFTFIKLLKFCTNISNWLSIGIVTNNNYSNPDIMIYGRIDGTRLYKSISVNCPRLDYEDPTELDWDSIEPDDRKSLVKFGKTIQRLILDAIEQKEKKMLD